MPILLIVARVLLVVIFVFSGARKLLDLPGTANLIAPLIVLPDAMADFKTQVQDITGMTLPYLLALASGIVEVIAGLLVAFNIGTRAAAAVLAIFTVAATFYFHDFWNMAGAARESNMIHALKNLSILGGLLTYVVIGAWRPLPANDHI